jgi:hypothetical protein
MSEKKEFLTLAEELYDTVYEEGKEDGREEAFASLSGLSLDELSAIMNGNGRKGGRTKKVASGGRKASKGGKRVRRSAEDLATGTLQVARVVKGGGKNGISAEDIRKELDIERKELPRLIAEALKQRLITKRGQKRATMYFAGSKNASGAKKTSSKKATKKAAPKKAKAKKSAPKKAKKASSKKAAHTNGITAVASQESAPASVE